MNALSDCMITNKVLVSYDLKFNPLYNNALAKFNEILDTAEHVNNIEISERVDKEILEEFKAKLASHKKKGKKGKKGKKKKKK